IKIAEPDSDGIFIFITSLQAVGAAPAGKVAPHLPQAATALPQDVLLRHAYLSNEQKKQEEICFFLKQDNLIYFSYATGSCSRAFNGCKLQQPPVFLCYKLLKGSH